MQSGAACGVWRVRARGRLAGAQPAQLRAAGPAGGVLTVKVKRVFAQGRAGGVLTVTRVFAQARAAPGSLGLHAAARRIAR